MITNPGLQPYEVKEDGKVGSAVLGLLSSEIAEGTEITLAIVNRLSQRWDT
jgi:hypothetical protein